MKAIYLQLFLLINGFLILNSQTINLTFDDDSEKINSLSSPLFIKEDSTILEEQPDYPGGVVEMSKFMNSKLTYPQSAIKDNICGTVIIRFLITKTGEIRDVKVIRGVRDDLDNEALRVIKMMPKWKPGEQNNKPVEVYFTVPVRFILDRKKKCNQ